MATRKQEKEFKDMMPSLDDVLEWISTELSPEDIYDDDLEDKLGTWATENGYVFEDEVDHEGWAEENGYVLEDEVDYEAWASENGYVDEDEVDHETWADENGYVLVDEIDYEGWAKENGYVLADDESVDAAWPFPVTKNKR